MRNHLMSKSGAERAAAVDAFFLVFFFFLPESSSLESLSSARIAATDFTAVPSLTPNSEATTWNVVMTTSYFNSSAAAARQLSEGMDYSLFARLGP